VTKDAEDPNPKPQDPNPNPQSDKSQAPPQSMPPQQQSSLVGEALDQACDQLLNEISIKIMLESNNRATRKTYFPLIEEELAAYNTLVDSPNHIHPSSGFVLPSSNVLAGDISTDTFDLKGSAVVDTLVVQAGLGGSTSPTAPLCAGTRPGSIGRRWDHPVPGLTTG
jgi:hypothetical protein